MVVLGGKCQWDDEGQVIETEMDSGGVGRHTRVKEMIRHQ